MSRYYFGVGRAALDLARNEYVVANEELRKPKWVGVRAEVQGPYEVRQVLG